MTPNNAAMQRQMIERAKQELKALQAQQGIAEYGVELLSNAAMDLQSAEDGTITREKAILSAVMALCALRLSELQTSATATAERIPVLETFLKQAESGLVTPNLVI